MNEKIKDVYIKFHTKRRLFIEEETEKVFQEMVADNWSDSPTTRKEALFVVMSKRNEQTDFEEFAELIIKEHLLVWNRMYNGNKVEGYVEMEDYPRAILKYFGITRSTK